MRAASICAPAMGAGVRFSICSVVREHEARQRRLVAPELIGVLCRVERRAHVLRLYVADGSTVPLHAEVGGAARDALRLVEGRYGFSIRFEQRLQGRAMGVLGGISGGKVFLDASEVRRWKRHESIRTRRAIQLLQYNVTLVLWK
ncbi:MAG: hypothetical protein BRD39_03165 [Bacteroidetes bacterium QH_9_64_21]|nr:MAG: hypothetical protein BRD39_03165 [Bacteroidetes bacterium QH_9_64_21]